ncbi:MAG TPA: hypothetical protein ENH28_01385 [Euryarchaeota archaeon]|nr:hypothetical protein [Euryarchaeota archaeon]
MRVIRSLYNNIISSASKPATIHQLASELHLSYKTAWNAVNRLKTAGLLTKTQKGYMAANTLTVADLIRQPFLLRSKHALRLLLLLNLKPAGVTEVARLLGTSPPLIQKVLSWMYEDQIVKKTRNSQYMLKQHIVGVELLPDSTTIVSLKHLLDATSSSIWAVLYSQGEFLITVAPASYYSITETQALTELMKKLKVKGVILPHFDWLLYLAGGFKKTPSLANFMFGTPAHGMPWLDRYEMASEFLTIIGKEQMETNIKKGLAKGVLKENEKGLHMTDVGVKKILFRIKGDVEFTEFYEGISLAKFR